MPCIVCGAATKENSLICDVCLQKEIKQGGKGAAPAPKAPPNKSLHAAPKSASAPSPKQPPKSSVSPGGKPVDKSLEGILDNLGDVLNVSDDVEFTSETKQPPVKKPVSEPDDDFNFEGEFDLNLDKTDTEIPTVPEYLFNLDTTSVKSGEEEMELPLDEMTPTGEDEADQIMDLEDEPETEDAGADILEIDSTIPEKVESDEDILKKKIKNRLQLKIQKTEPEEEKSESVDDIIDEVLLDEIEDIRQLDEKEEKTAPVTKEVLKTSKPTQPESQSSAEKKESSKAKKEGDLLNELLKPIEKGQARQEFSISDKGKISDKKETAPIATDAVQKDKPLSAKKKKDPFEGSETIIRGTTSGKSRRRKEKKSSKGFFITLLILIILGGGGYAVYEFYLKKDPVREKLVSIVTQARQAESSGNYEGAILLYQSVINVAEYQPYPEAGAIPDEIERLQSELEKEAEIAKHQEEITNLLTRADVLFKKNRWIGGRSALSIYREVLKIDPNNSIAKNKIEEMKLGYLNRGNANLKQKRFKTAKANFENVLTIEPGNAVASSSLDLVSTMIEQQTNQNAESRRRQQEIEAAQKKLDDDLAARQRQIEEENNREAERKRRETQQQEEARKERERIESQKNEVVIEGLVDGNRRVYVKRVTPQIPSAAVQNNISGTVYIEVIVNNEGIPENVTVTKSDNELLSQSAVEAIKQFRYKPPTKGGQPCKMKLTERIVFK